MFKLPTKAEFFEKIRRDTLNRSINPKENEYLQTAINYLFSICRNQQDEIIKLTQRIEILSNKER